jgi:hypothetical protein
VAYIGPSVRMCIFSVPDARRCARTARVSTDYVAHN